MEKSPSGQTPDAENATSSGDGILALPAKPGKGRPFRWVAIGLVALAAAGIWLASLRRPTGAAAGTSVEGPSLSPGAARTTFRVGTWNIHGGVGRDGQRDMARLARCIQGTGGLDFVGLNEVHGWAWSARSSQAALLGSLLDVGWLYAPAEQRWYCQQFGNGLLTVLPVQRWDRIPLPGKFATSCRNLVLVKLGQQERAVQILLTHLVRGDVALRGKQLEKASSLFLSLAEPAVMMGDLNTDGSDPQIAKLLATPGVVDASGSAGGSKAHRGIDWILVRGVRVVDAGQREDGASDHPLVWAELAWPAGMSSANSQRRGMAISGRQRLQ